MQIGGSDQWGNITAGIELVRKTARAEVYGLTMPLVTRADGKKMGKSESGAVWLDPALTSPYHFYQFWLNIDDADVIKFLKYYTFLTLDEIAELERSLQSTPEKREAQKALADAITEFVHGKEELEQAKNISAKLFSGDITTLAEDPHQFKKLFVGNLAVKQCDSTALASGTVSFVAFATDISNRQAREDIANGAIEINGKKITDSEYQLGKTDFVDDMYAIVKRGKKTIAFVEITNKETP